MTTSNAILRAIKLRPRIKINRRYLPDALCLAAQGKIRLIELDGEHQIVSAVEEGK